MRMKFSLFVFCAGLLATMMVGAYPTDEHGNLLVSLPLANLCQTKGDMTVYVYKHRSEYTEEQMLADLADDWHDVYSKTDYVEYHSYVDMQRIIRDAYRKDSKGAYIRDCCTEDDAQLQADKEYQVCLHYTEY